MWQWPSNLAFLTIAIAWPAPLLSEPCSYQTWEWDTVHKRSVHHQRVVKLKSELSDNEKGTTDGCSVCSEDQLEVQIDGLPPFTSCKLFAAAMKRAIMQAKDDGFPISSIIGYRVGKSKGPMDSTITVSSLASAVSCYVAAFTRLVHQGRSPKSLASTAPCTAKGSSGAVKSTANKKTSCTFR